MKLAKKVLAAVMAIAMIAGLSAMAFAAGPAISLEFGEVKNGQVKAFVYFDNAVGLKSWDTTITYDSTVLSVKSIVVGADGNMVNKTADNSYTQEKNTSEEGKILFSGYFKETLWTADAFANNAADDDDPVTVNATHFHAATITFNVAESDKTSTDVVVAVTSDNGFGLAGTTATLKLKDAPQPSTSDVTGASATVTAPSTEKPTDSSTKATEKTTNDANPTKGNGHNGKGNVNTGDNMALVAAGAVVILAGAAFVISKKKK